MCQKVSTLDTIKIEWFNREEKQFFLGDQDWI